jgi:predicted nuclease of restriction endonuclease-like (RecB) superfamily
MKLDKSYKSFIVELKQKIYSSKTKAILFANRLMIELYFEIGEQIVLNQEKQGWGKSVVEQMSKDLKDEFGEKSGYSSSNLWRMRNFYLTYREDEYLAQLVRDISWGQNILIFEKCKKREEREYYIKSTIEFGWNRNVLTHHIQTKRFNRDDKTKKLNNTVKMPHENPSIGIILCSDKDSLEVEYSLLNTSAPMGVSTYSVKDTLPNELKNSLPTQEELQNQLLGDNK